jgi:hypothetical protein
MIQYLTMFTSRRMGCMLRRDMGDKVEGWVAKERDRWLRRGMGGKVEGWVAN